MTTTAQVRDMAPSHFRRIMKTKEVESQPGTSITDDFADGIEAVHQLSNLAGFSERPRAFIFALATAAHNAGETFVELFDDDLARLQGCSTKTVRRQRADYLAESKARRFGFVEIIEGDFNKSTDRNAPTRYRFHVGGQIAEAVALARRAQGWQGMSRMRQREEIARACEEVFHTIPDARQQGRKRKRPRLAEDEIETCLKVAASKLHRAQELASKLPDHSRAELLEDDPRGLRQRWLEVRAGMDALFGDSLQSVEGAQVDRGTGQLVHTPSDPLEAADEDGFKVGANAEQRDLWSRMSDRLTEPPVQSRAIELRDTGPPPAGVPDETEVRERVAVMVESGALDEESARGFEELAHDPLTREVFARRFMRGALAQGGVT